MFNFLRIFKKNAQQEEKVEEAIVTSIKSDLEETKQTLDLLKKCLETMDKDALKRGFTPEGIQEQIEECNSEIVYFENCLDWLADKELRHEMTDQELAEMEGELIQACAISDIIGPYS